MNHAMAGRILALIIYRIVLISMILLYQVLSRIPSLVPFPQLPFRGILLICVIVSIFSGGYLWYLKYKLRDDRDPSNFIFFQFTIDIFAISGLVMLTGGFESNARFAYLIVILLSALFLEKITIYAITVLALSFFFLALNVTPLLGGNPLWDPLFAISPSIRYAMLGQFVLCFLTALLSGFMQTAYRTSRQALDLKEQRIRSLREMRQKIVESLPSGLVTCGQDGDITFINRKGKKLLQRDAVGDNAWDLFQIAPIAKNEGNAMTLSRVERRVEVKGMKRIFGISYGPIDVDAGKPGYLMVFQDLTKIKFLEEHQKLDERMSAMGKMAAGVAHEIRNPLASISGSIQVLKEMIPEDETTTDLAAIVERESQRLNDIISQFLAYARPGSPPDFKPIDLVDCIHDFVRLTQNDAHLKTLRITLDLPSPGCLILGDRAKLNQVFWNLMKNSHHASSPGGEVLLGCRLENDEVCFKIKDQGVGMTEDQLKDLFTPFLSFSKSGTGLGMSIVYGIVTMHRGRLHVDSKPGVGTEVGIQFPHYTE